MDLKKKNILCFFNIYLFLYLGFVINLYNGLCKEDLIFGNYDFCYFFYSEF